MSDSPTTRPSLLARLGNVGDTQAWEQFVTLYTPLIYGYCVRRSLQPADAADISQDVMSAVIAGIHRFDYDTQRGSFRGWLLTITRRKVSDFLSKLDTGARGSGDSAVQRLIESQPDPTDVESCRWERQFRSSVFAWATNLARAEFTSNTWKAFWLTAVENKPIEQVAVELGLSRGAVYITRCRVMARLRQLVASVEEFPKPMSTEGGR